LHALSRAAASERHRALSIGHARLPGCAGGRALTFTAASGHRCPGYARARARETITAREEGLTRSGAVAAANHLLTSHDVPLRPGAESPFRTTHEPRGLPGILARSKGAQADGA